MLKKTIILSLLATAIFAQDDLSCKADEGITAPNWVCNPQERHAVGVGPNEKVALINAACTLTQQIESRFMRQAGSSKTTADYTFGKHTKVSAEFTIAGAEPERIFSSVCNVETMLGNESLSAVLNDVSKEGTEPYSKSVYELPSDLEKFIIALSLDGLTIKDQFKTKEATYVYLKRASLESEDVEAEALWKQFQQTVDKEALWEEIDKELAEDN